MVDWHVNEGLKPFVDEMKIAYPGIVIGTIGDTAHQTVISDHNPNKAERVNAADPMLGDAFTKDDADRTISRILHDPRVRYIIWWERIWKPSIGWRPYGGKDPHKGHFHLSVLDSAYKDTRPWNVEGRTVVFQNVSGYFPTLLYGDEDPVGGIFYVSRLQYNLNYKLKENITVDGEYGPKTRDAVSKVLGNNGLKVGPDEWMLLYAMKTHGQA